MRNTFINLIPIGALAMVLSGCESLHHTSYNDRQVGYCDDGGYYHQSQEELNMEMRYRENESRTFYYPDEHLYRTDPDWARRREEYRRRDEYGDDRWDNNQPGSSSEPSA